MDSSEIEKDLKNNVVERIRTRERESSMKLLFEAIAETTSWFRVQNKLSCVWSRRGQTTGQRINGSPLSSSTPCSGNKRPIRCYRCRHLRLLRFPLFSVYTPFILCFLLDFQAHSLPSNHSAQTLTIFVTISTLLFKNLVTNLQNTGLCLLRTKPRDQKNF